MPLLLLLCIVPIIWLLEGALVLFGLTFFGVDFTWARAFWLGFFVFLASHLFDQARRK